jgi:hypothetical protein
MARLLAVIKSGASDTAFTSFYGNGKTKFPLLFGFIINLSYLIRALVFFRCLPFVLPAVCFPDFFERLEFLAIIYRKNLFAGIAVGVATPIGVAGRPPSDERKRAFFFCHGIHGLLKIREAEGAGNTRKRLYRTKLNSMKSVTLF